MRAQLWDRKTDQVVWADVIAEVTPQQLVQIEAQWTRFRVQAEERRRRERIPVPEHNHWNWDEKSHELKFTAYRCLGIWFEGEAQGLMMISTLAAAGRLASHRGKPVL
jgi:hypothetical protein